MSRDGYTCKHSLFKQWLSWLKWLVLNSRLYAVTKPSTGRSAKLETFAELSKRFEKITDPDEAKVLWEEHYEGEDFDPYSLDCSL